MWRDAGKFSKLECDNNTSLINKVTSMLLYNGRTAVGIRSLVHFCSEIYASRSVAIVF